MGYIFGFQLLRGQKGRSRSTILDGKINRPHDVGIYSWNPNGHCFDLEFRPCFGGLGPFKKQGRLGSRFKIGHHERMPLLTRPRIMYSQNSFDKLVAKFLSEKDELAFPVGPRKNCQIHCFFFECSPPGDSKWPFYKGSQNTIPTQKGHTELPGQYFSCAIFLRHIFFSQVGLGGFNHQLKSTNGFSLVVW